jgi:hypothetical protein
MDPVQYFQMVQNIVYIQKEVYYLSKSANPLEREFLEELKSLLKTTEQVALLCWLRNNGFCA